MRIAFLASFTLAALLLSSSARADDLSLDTMAKVEHEREKALKKLKKSYGNRKPKDMSSDERRNYIKAQSAAQKKVLDDLGVSGKSFARKKAKLSRSKTKKLEEKVETLRQNDKKPKTIEIIRGTDPVVEVPAK